MGRPKDQQMSAIPVPPVHERSLECTILEVEKIGEGVVVTFSDGCTALFSASFLHANIDKVEEVVFQKDVWDS